jgi:hypothetical protein
VRVLTTAVFTFLPQTPLLALLLIGTATGVIVAVVAILFLDRGAVELAAGWNYVSTVPFVIPDGHILIIAVVCVLHARELCADIDELGLVGLG